MEGVSVANRWAFLATASLVHVTNRMHNDQLAPMVGRICGTADACSDGSDSSCLAFDSTHYNTLYVSFDWAAMVGAATGGFLLRKFGVWTLSLANAVLLFSGMLFLTLGPYLKFNSDAAYSLMVTGRVIFGFSFFFEIVLTLQVLSHWFPPGQLGKAYATYFAAGKIGNIIAVAAAGFMVEEYGLQKTLWITFGVDCLGVVCCVLAGVIYKRTEEKRGTVEHQVQKDSIIHEAMRLSSDFWILCGIICLYYSVALGSQPDIPKFLIEALGFSEASSGLLVALNPIMSLLAPLFGILIDRYGHRSTQTFFAMFLLLLPLILQATVPTFPPGYTIFFIGLTYAICSASLWSSISVTEPGAVVGIAMGLATGAQQFGVGLNLLVSGFLLDTDSDKKWYYYFGLQAGLIGSAWILSMVSAGIDWKWRGKRLLRKHTHPANTTSGPSERKPLMRKVSSYAGSALSNLPPE